MSNRAFLSLPDRCDLRMRLADPVGEAVTEANRILDHTEPPCGAHIPLSSRLTIPRKFVWPDGPYLSLSVIQAAMAESLARFTKE